MSYNNPQTIETAHQSVTLSHTVLSATCITCGVMSVTQSVMSDAICKKTRGGKGKWLLHIEGN